MNDDKTLLPSCILKLTLNDLHELHDTSNVWQILYVGSMKPSISRDTIFKINVNERELRMSFEEKDNKQNDANIKNWELSFYSHNIALRNVYKHKCLVTIFSNEHCYEWFPLFLLFNPFTNGLQFVDDFL